jgi:hypothetical protein
MRDMLAHPSEPVQRSEQLRPSEVDATILGRESTDADSVRRHLEAGHVPGVRGGSGPLSIDDR